jgi:predicted dehydrogenase
VRVLAHAHASGLRSNHELAWNIPTEENAMNDREAAVDRPVPNRRTFVKGSAAAAGAALLGTLKPGRYAHAAGSDVLKLGLIGCGGRGAGAASDALSADPNTKLWAAADVFADKIDEAVKQLTGMFGDRVQVDGARRFAGLDGYRGVIENCDVVLIACASRFHPKYALAAAQAKKPLFVEKPGAIDVAGINQLLEAAALSEKNGSGLLAGLTYRYHLGRREAIERIRNGEIGEIVAIQCDYLRTPYRLITRDPKWTEMQYQLRNWYHFTWLSGDDVLQSLVHNFDSALWVLGDQPPLQAYGLGGRSTHFQVEMGTSFDHHACVLEYADGKRVYGFGRTAVGCFGSNVDVFHGTKGRCIFQAFAPPRFTDLKGVETWKASAELSKASPYKQEHVDFFRSLREGRPFQDGKRMATSTLTTMLGQVTAYNGKRVTWEELLASKFAFPPAGEVRMDMEPPVQLGKDGIYPVAIPGSTKLWGATAGT